MKVAEFPTELPIEAGKQIIKFATKQDADLGRAGLAAWNLLGYAGHLAFGDVKLETPMPQAGPTDWAATMATAEASNVIPPELIDLALAILSRWLKQRFARTT
jgi:hypothetical protein